jgi:lantibiotic modifying enzyme
MINFKKLLTGTLTIMVLCCTCTAGAVESVSVLELAEETGRWLADAAIPQDAGTAWSEDVLNPEEFSYDLATGASGTVVYFIALYRATGNSAYLDDAKLGAEYLISVINTPARFEDDQRRSSLYSGISGIGVALMHVRKEAAGSKYDTALNTVLTLLERWSVFENDMRHWSEKFNDLLYGDAGTVLFLSHYARESGNDRASKMARQGAQFLLSEARQDGDGSYWLFRRDKEFNLPNFSHGTAGVSYALASAGGLTGDESITAGARSGFSYLRSIAEHQDGRIRIPYGWGSDSWDGLYEFGWAHGLTGMAAMLEQMKQAGIDARIADDYLTSVRHTLMDIELPRIPTAPFAEPSTPLDKRFGRAGVLSLFSDWSKQHPENKAVSRFRDALWKHIESAAIRENGRAHWQVDAPAFMGGGRAAYTGLLHGAAGIGLAILRMHAGLTGHDRYDGLPDDPF